MDTFLPHAVGECAGDFEQHGKRGSGFWRCAVCGREHPSTPENDRAADREFAFGVMLRHEARMWRISQMPQPPERPPLMIELPEEGEG